MSAASGAITERGPLLRRRLAWLAVFGLSMALLIWYGDILLIYAIAGVAADVRALVAAARRC